VPDILAEISDRAAHRLHHKPVTPEVLEAVARFSAFQQHIMKTTTFENSL